jgi:glutaredoxin-related protein
MFLEVCIEEVEQRDPVVEVALGAQSSVLKYACVSSVPQDHGLLTLSAFQVNASNPSASWSSGVLNTLSRKDLIAAGCIYVISDYADARHQVSEKRYANWRTVSAAFFAFAFMLCVAGQSIVGEYSACT